MKPHALLMMLFAATAGCSGGGGSNPPQLFLAKNGDELHLQLTADEPPPF